MYFSEIKYDDNAANCQPHATSPKPDTAVQFRTLPLLSKLFAPLRLLTCFEIWNLIVVLSAIRTVNDSITMEAWLGGQ